MQGDITQLLNRWLGGDGRARDALFDLVYDDLRRMAARHTFRERPGHTLSQPAALVSEAYLKIQSYQPVRWESRAHFYAVFSRAMRQILVDHARGKRTAKRGGDQRRVDIEDGADVPGKNYEALLELDSVLDRLTREHPHASCVFHLRHFTGLTAEEIAEVLETSATSVNRALARARRWLRDELKTALAARPPQTRLATPRRKD